MAIYDWRGRNNRGEAVDGQLEAMTDGGVAEKVLANAPDRAGDWYAVPKVVE